MTLPPTRCLILACGNTLRGDDGIGPWLAAWAEEHFDGDPDVRVLSRQQWTPDLAEELANAASVIFVDCAVDADPGAVQVTPVQPAPALAGLATHHVGAAELLSLTQELYGSLPRNALLMTIGAGSAELGESFSKPVTASLPHACQSLADTIRTLLAPHPSVDLENLA